jgi:CelD/BcsL family acetyltransferase involved in cellulose biosynthesis
METVLPLNAQLSFGVQNSEKAKPVLELVIVESLAELQKYESKIADLSRRAIEPNPFYGPDMLFPAIEHLKPTNPLLFVLVLEKDKQQKLCGLFPLELRPAIPRLPVRILTFWRHKFCPFCAPLIDTDQAEQVLHSFLDWFSGRPFGVHILDINMFPAEGHLHVLFSSVLWRTGLLHVVAERWPRACLAPAETAEKYLGRALCSKRRRQYRKVLKQLSDLGPTELTQLKPDDDASNWIEDFLRLEASGWKGRESSALASNNNDASFFRQVVRNAFRAGRLQMNAIRHCDQAIAMICCIRSGPTSFFFKTGYDETYDRFSPGALALIGLTCEVHQQLEVQLVDSCSSSSNTLLNMHWTERRIIERLLISNSPLSGLWVSSMPVLRWLRQRLSPVIRSRVQAKRPIIRDEN